MRALPLAAGCFLMLTAPAGADWLVYLDGGL